MTKKDLRTGMVVENNYGDRYVVMDDIIFRLESYDGLSNYNDDLTNKVSNRLTIVKVYGARGASLKRMLENPGEPIWERPTYYNGKVVCVATNDNNFVTKGKIYEFKDGYSVDDVGSRLPVTRPVESLEDLNIRLYSKYIEVVE